MSRFLRYDKDMNACVNRHIIMNNKCDKQFAMRFDQQTGTGTIHKGEKKDGVQLKEIN